MNTTNSHLIRFFFEGGPTVPPPQMAPSKDYIFDSAVGPGALSPFHGLGSKSDKDDSGLGSGTQLLALGSIYLSFLFVFYHPLHVEGCKFLIFQCVVIERFSQYRPKLRLNSWDLDHLKRFRFGAMVQVISCSMI